MKIVLSNIGTTGDVQPMFALSAALRAAGHETQLALPKIFAARAALLGLPFTPIAPDLDQETMRRAIQSQIAEGGTLTSRDCLLESTLPMLPDLYAGLKSACQGADLLIGTPSHLACRMVYEDSGIPFVTIHLSPLGIVRAGALRDTSAPMINSWRTRMGFPALPDPLGYDGASPQLALHAVSRLLLRPGPQWPSHHYVTGFLFLDEAWLPNAELRAFLEAGDPPVFVSLGSTVCQDPQTVTELMVTAVRRAGRRAILQHGWSRLADSLVAEDVYIIDFVPYGRLFPLTACIVHHGGAGTTASALRAGVPSVVAPHFHDQPIWAHLARSLGCAGGVVPGDRLTAENLSESIVQTLASPRLRQTAAAVGQKIEAERGNEAAVALIESCC